MSKAHPLIREAIKQKAKQLHIIQGYVGPSKGGITPIYSDLDMQFRFEVEDGGIVEVIEPKEIQNPQLVVVSEKAIIHVVATIKPHIAEIITKPKSHRAPAHPDCHGDNLCNECMADPDTTSSLDRFLCKLTAPGPMTGEFIGR